MADLYLPSSGPLRSKRNFKALSLSAEASSSTPPAGNAGPGGKKRPPPLGAGGPALGAPLGMCGLGGVGGGPLAYDDLPAEGQHSAMQASLSDKLAKLELKKQIKDLKNDDFKKLAELGQGNGGSVEKVEHIPTGTVMAKKSVLIDTKSDVTKQIIRELEIMHECQSDFIISCYGSYLAEPNICICMEYMDKGSFDGIYKRVGPLTVEVVAVVAYAVLEGLTYLYDEHRIMHRDIKPSNILFNSLGQIKLCDFGVSGELINSIANTFVGTSVYMSPERIHGAGKGYSVKSDVWSLGISLVELALGAFPYTDPPDDDDLSDLEDSPNGGATPTHRDSFMLGRKLAARRASKRVSKLEFNPDGGLTTMSIFELIHQIVQEPSPRLPDGNFPQDAMDFVDGCLLKDPDARKTPKALLSDPWIQAAKASNFDMAAWATTL